MTESQLRAIWNKTNGHCHFCGDPVSFRKCGYRRQRADGCWEVDHVIQKDKGGAISVENCLPACTKCNRLRWHRKGAEIRELLLLGLIARREINKLTETGQALVRLKANQNRRTALRREWNSVGLIKLRDPVLIERTQQEQRDRLVHFLRRHRKRRFTAAELSKHTRVGKKWVRRLLETSRKVSLIRDSGRYTFQGRPPKKRT